MNEDAVREKLSVTLQAHGMWWAEDKPGVLDALLPVVREIAAEELREAAANWTDYRLATVQLRERADALTKPPDGPVR